MSANQARSQIFEVLGTKYIFSGARFCFYCMLKKFLGTKNFGHFPQTRLHGNGPAAGNYYAIFLMCIINMPRKFNIALVCVHFLL